MSKAYTKPAALAWLITGINFGGFNNRIQKAIADYNSKNEKKITTLDDLALLRVTDVRAIKGMKGLGTECFLAIMTKFAELKIDLKDYAMNLDPETRKVAQEALEKRVASLTKPAYAFTKNENIAIVGAATIKQLRKALSAKRFQDGDKLTIDEAGSIFVHRIKRGKILAAFQLHFADPNVGANPGVKVERK